MQIACAGESCYPHTMAIHLQIRDLPDELHQTLRRRAAVHSGSRGRSRGPRGGRRRIDRCQL